MNESGRAVRAFLDFYKLAPGHVFIVNDDVELEFGAMRLRPTGSAGGHNGLKSVEAHLGTKHYVRLRLGIGRSKAQESLRIMSGYLYSGRAGVAACHFKQSGGSLKADDDS